MGFITIITLLIFSMGCGQHENRRSTFNLGGTDQSTEAVVDPLLKLQLSIADNQADEFFKIINENKYSVNLVLPSSRELLMEAIFFKRSKIIRGLKRLGASEENKTLEGLSVRDWIDLQSEKNKILRSLEKTIEDDVRDLNEALSSQNYQSIKSLLDEDIDPNYLLEKGETPLTWSIQKKSMTALRALLISPLLNVNFLNQKGESALWWARQLQMRAVVTELQRRGAIETGGEL